MTCFQRPPTFVLHKCSFTNLINRQIWKRVWTNIWRLSGNRQRGLKSEEKRKFLSESLDCALFTHSSPFCVKFWVVCSLVISFACRMGGELRLRLDERGISLTKSVSTTKRRLHQITLIPTHTGVILVHWTTMWKKNKKNSLICWRLGFFLTSALIEIPFNFPLKCLIIHENLVLVLKFVVC